MTQAIQKNECAKFVAVIALDWLRLCPNAASALTREIDPSLLKRAPDKTRTIVAIRSRRSVMIRRAIPLLDRLIQPGAGRHPIDRFAGGHAARSIDRFRRTRSLYKRLGFRCRFDNNYLICKYRACGLRRLWFFDCRWNLCRRNMCRLAAGGFNHSVTILGLCRTGKANGSKRNARRKEKDLRKIFQIKTPTDLIWERAV